MKKNNKVLVLGAGVIGISVAYYLNKEGYDVTVIDKQPKPGLECSYANGAQLSYTNSEPWATYANLKKAILWLTKKDAPFLFRIRADWQLYKWLFGFLRECTQNRRLKNTKTVLQLGLYSKDLFQDFVKEEKISFDYKESGILHIFHNEKDLEGGKYISDFQQALGAPYKLLSQSDCFAREPALAKEELKDDVKGGILYPNEDIADIHKFCVELGKILKNRGVSFIYEEEIIGANLEGSTISSVETKSEIFEADKIVLAMGSNATNFLKNIGIKVPIYSAKGYSITYDIKNTEKAVKHSITDQKYKMVYTNIGNRMRVAGMVELSGFDNSIIPHRINALKDITKKYFSDSGDIENAEEWACLRPCTPDGPPVLGKSPIDNLYLAIGNGARGWTQSLATGKILTDIISGRKTGIDIKNSLLDRF